MFPQIHQAHLGTIYFRWTCLDSPITPDKLNSAQSWFGQKDVPVQAYFRSVTKVRWVGKKLICKSILTAWRSLSPNVCSYCYCGGTLKHSNYVVEASLFQSEYQLNFKNKMLFYVTGGSSTLRCWMSLFLSPNSSQPPPPRNTREFSIALVMWGLRCHPSTCWI